MAKGTEAVTFDLGIYCSANLLIKQHGEDPPLGGAPKANAILVKDDSKGLAVCNRI